MKNLLIVRFNFFSFCLAVRADRMRGGRNKFGPMYKRDRARKLQIMRQRQLAVQALRAVEGNTSQLSPTGYQQPYSNMNIKQEIQIPQVNNGTGKTNFNWLRSFPKYLLYIGIDFFADIITGFVA